MDDLVAKANNPEILADLIVQRLLENPQCVECFANYNELEIDGIAKLVI